MTEGEQAWAAFTAALEPEARAALPADGASLFAEILCEARAARREIGVPAVAFSAFLGTKVKDSAAPLADLRERQIADLLLTFAVIAGVAEAIDAFDAIVRRIGTRVHGSVRTTLSVDELHQELRVHLLVDRPDARARIREFGGRGSLEHWTRVAATRCALNLARRPKRELPFEDAFFRAQPDLVNADARILDAHYGAAVRAAVGTAMANLAERDRALLWFSLVDGQPAEQIAKVYGVHRTTAMRWITRAAADLRAAVEKELARDARLEGSELSSIVRTVLARAADG